MLKLVAEIVRSCQSPDGGNTRPRQPEGVGRRLVQSRRLVICIVTIVTRGVNVGNGIFCSREIHQDKDPDPVMSLVSQR